MKLIEIFENCDNQNVETFENVFNLNLNSETNDQVEILELCDNDQRLIKVGKIIRKIDLNSRKRIQNLLDKVKVCNLCKREKDLLEFSPKKGYKLGVNSRCKSCCVKIVRDIQKRNKKC